MLGAILDIGKSIAGNMFAEEQQKDQQVFNSAEAAKNRDFNAAEAKEQREWQHWMRAHAYQETTADLRAAGLNPMLAYMHGATSGGQGAAATGSTASSGIASPVNRNSIASGMQSASQISVNDAIIERTRAEADKVKAETDEIRGARIPERLQNIEVMKQNIQESVNRIDRIRQEIATGRASEANLRQQTINLQAELPRINATIQNLKAQTIETLTRSGLNEAHAKEVKQRIDANLPALERMIGELEGTKRRMEQPAQEASAAAADSFTGWMGARLKALGIGLNNLMIGIPTGKGRK